MGPSACRYHGYLSYEHLGIGSCLDLPRSSRECAGLETSGVRLATLKDRQRESLEVKIAGHQTKGTPCQEQENLEWINPPLITDELKSSMHKIGMLQTHNPQTPSYSGPKQVQTGNRSGLAGCRLRSLRQSSAHPANPARLGNSPHTPSAFSSFFLFLQRTALLLETQSALIGGSLGLLFCSHIPPALARGRRKTSPAAGWRDPIARLCAPLPMWAHRNVA